MDSRPVAAILKQLEATTLQVEEIEFDEKGNVRRISIYRGPRASQAKQPDQGAPADDKKPKAKTSAIKSLSLGDRHWRSS